jgi:hypothetical protein
MKARVYTWYWMTAGILGFCWFLHGDGWLYVFSLLCAYVCGVPWELSNWRIQQGYPNGEVIPQE